MAYYTDLFTVETYEAYLRSDRSVSGFRETQLKMATRVKPGDKLVAYIKGVSRWAAVLKVLEGPFTDSTPLFVADSDPFVIRFRVTPAPALSIETAIPIRSPEVFDSLSFSKGRQDGYWLGPLRRSLQHLDEADGALLERMLVQQAKSPVPYPIEESELDTFRITQVKRADGVVAVTVPKDDIIDLKDDIRLVRESTMAQADLARLGETMGFRIWLPRNDRTSVLKLWQPTEGTLLSNLPLNYDDTTLKTIEQIDVIWLKGRAIQRAFEVEHTTAVYSGLLRMADLLALQPNMNIALHIVAPEERREKVLSEIRRPVFSLLEHQPLAERCTFISYESLNEVMSLQHLSHVSDSVLEEYEDRSE